MKTPSAALVAALLLISACAPQTTQPTNDINPDTGTGAIEESSQGALNTGSGSLDINSEEVTYATMDGKEIKGFVAYPESGSGTYPGLVLIHEWWGLNENIRDLAEQYAAQGYVALAVDLYEGESTTDQARARELTTSVSGNMPRANDNLRQATAYLRSRPDVKGHALASVGWCFGGAWSYQMAKNDMGLDASVMYYGQFSPHEDHSHMKTDIIGHFGAEDMSIKVNDVETFQATLKTASGDHEIYIYPNSGHGFANEDNADAYNPEAAALAWQRTLTFLRAHVE